MSTPSAVRQSSTNPSASDPLLAFQNLFNFLEPYKLVVVAVLALSSPVGWGWSFSSPSELWSHSLLLTGLALLGFVAPTATFSGPLRFGYLEYGPLISTFCQHLPSWSPYSVLVFVFLPSSRSWMMCALPVGWQYVLQNYRENVRDIRDEVEYARSRAMVAANSAREYAREASEYEKQVLEVVAVTRRDAMLAQSVKITDFFDRAVESWAALGRITAPAKEVTNAARAAEDDARTVTECEPPHDQGRAEYLANILLEKATIAVASALDAENKAKFAQATITESQNAQRQVADARRQALANAENAAKAAKALKDRIAETSATLFKASEGVEEVRRLADQAMAAAVEGNKKTALSLAADAESAADEVVNAKEKLSSAKEGAHNILLELLLGKALGPSMR